MTKCYDSVQPADLRIFAGEWTLDEIREAMKVLRAAFNEKKGEGVAEFAVGTVVEWESGEARYKGVVRKQNTKSIGVTATHKWVVDAWARLRKPVTWRVSPSFLKFV